MFHRDCCKCPAGSSTILLRVLRLEMNFLFEALVAFSKGQVRGRKFCMLERLAACPAKRKCASYVYVKALSRVQVRNASFASARWGALRGVGNDLVGPRLSREVSGETQTVAQSNERERLVLAKPTFVASLCALEAGAVFHVRSRLLQVPRFEKSRSAPCSVSTCAACCLCGTDFARLKKCSLQHLHRVAFTRDLLHHLGLNPRAGWVAA